MMSHIIDVPLVLRQEAFPTRDILIKEEAKFGNICNAFASFSQKQESYDEATEVKEVISGKCASKYV